MKHFLAFLAVVALSSGIASRHEKPVSDHFIMCGLLFFCTFAVVRAIEQSKNGAGK